MSVFACAPASAPNEPAAQAPPSGASPAEEAVSARPGQPGGVTEGAGPADGGVPGAPDAGGPGADAGTPDASAPDASRCQLWSHCPVGHRCVDGRCAPFAWSRLGPGGGGTQGTPRFSPHSARQAVVSCDMTGAYLTRNAGESWDEFNVRTVLGDAAFDPTHPDVVYAASTGIFRSENGGRSFQLVFPDPGAVLEDGCGSDDHAAHYFRSSDNWPGGRATGIAVDPQDGRRLYAVINGDLWVSTDRGARWSEVGAVGDGWNEGTRVRSVKAFVDTTTSLSARQVYFFSKLGVRRYDASAGTLTPVPSPAGMRDAAFGFDPTRPGGVVFYAVANGALHRSLDRGGSWTSLGGPNLHLVACALSDARTVWAASTTGFGILKSTDSGQSFAFSLREDCSGSSPNYRSGWLERLWSPCWPGPAHELAVAPNDPGAVLATDYGRVYGTFDGGGRWAALYSSTHADQTVSSTGIDVTTSYGVHVDPFDPDHLVVSFTDVGMFHSRDRGRSWRSAVRGIPGGWVNSGYWMVFDPAVKGRGWSAWGSAHDLPLRKMWSSVPRAAGGVASTADGAESWAPSNAGLPSGVTTHLELDPQSPPGNRTLYATVFGRGVYKSVDDGRSWSARNQGIGHTGAWRVVRSPGGALYHVAAYFNGPGAVYRSVDGAASWQPLTLPPGVTAPRDLAVDPTDPRRLYLTAWTDGGSHGGAYVSPDEGKTWSNLLDPRYQVYALAVDARRPQVLWATTFWGRLFRSEDGGKSWMTLPGFDFKWAHRPIVDPSDPDSLYVTTFGSSVWHGP